MPADGEGVPAGGGEGGRLSGERRRLVQQALVGGPPVLRHGERRTADGGGVQVRYVEGSELAVLLLVVLQRLGPGQSAPPGPQGVARGATDVLLPVRDVVALTSERIAAEQGPALRGRSTGSELFLEEQAEFDLTQVDQLAARQCRAAGAELPHHLVQGLGSATHEFSQFGRSDTEL